MGLETLIGIGKFDTIVSLIMFVQTDVSGLLSSSRKGNLLLHGIPFITFSLICLLPEGDTRGARGLRLSTFERVMNPSLTLSIGSLGGGVSTRSVNLS